MSYRTHPWIQRQALGLIALGLMALMPRAAHAANLIVNSNADSGPGSLREIIAAASAGDTITFDPSLSGQTITETSGTINISTPVTITAPVGGVSVSGNNANTVFAVSGGTSSNPVVLNNLTIEDGNAGDQGYGGGLSNTGTLTLTGCTVTSNNANGGDAGGGLGGGLYNVFGTVTLTNCTFGQNNASNDGDSGGEGGGLYNVIGTLTLTGCIVTQNTAYGDGGGGGGLYSNSGTITLTGCTVNENSTNDGQGGGLYSTGTVTLINSTVTENSANGNFGQGGGIYNASTVILTGCTITQNTANGEGGGLYTFGTATLTNDILYGNSSSNGAEVRVDSGTGTASYCDIGEALGSSGDGVTDNGNNINADPKFVGTGADPYAVQSISHCIGAGSSDAPDYLPYDIIGTARVNPPTIGAYEFVLATATVLNSNLNPSHSGQNVTFTATVTNTTNGVAPTGKVQFFVDGSSTPAATPNVDGNGQATYSISSLSIGSHQITATFVGNSPFATSGSSPLTQQVNAGTPTANAQSVSTNENTATPITLTGSDPDSPPLSLTFATSTGPAHGTLSGTAPNLTYTPNPGYFGSDSFTFTVSNGYITSAPATVNITVNQVATHLGVTAPSTAIVGQSVGVTVSVLDAGNSVVSVYSGSGTLTSSDPRAILPSSLSFSNGSASANVTFNTAGSQSLNASANGLTGSTNVTVSSAATGTPKIAIGGISLSRSGSNVTVQFTLTNSGNGEADNVHMTLAKLAGISANSLPSGITLGAGQVTAVSLTFPGVAAGSQTLQFTGAYTAASNGATGSFTSTTKVTVP